MSGYILCQVRRAKLPYYIENISTNIYSIEELCFYLYHNIYLLDATIMNEELCFWIRDELGLRKLASKLYAILDQDPVRVGDFILPVFKEINYLSLEEFRKLNRKIQKLAEEPEVVRQKIKGDYLMEHGKYANAIKVYQKALHQQESEKKTAETEETGAQLPGEIWHNMGCAYIRLFQAEEARICFSNACKYLPGEKTVRSYLYAVYMEQGEDAFLKEAEDRGISEEQQLEWLEKAEEAGKQLEETVDGQKYGKALEAKQKGDFESYHQMLQEILDHMVHEYHRSISK